MWWAQRNQEKYPPGMYVSLFLLLAESALHSRDHRPQKSYLRAKGRSVFRVGNFLDFVWLTTRTMHPHGAYVRVAERTRIDPHWGGIERLLLRTRAGGRGSCLKQSAAKKRGEAKLVSTPRTRARRGAAARNSGSAGQRAAGDLPSLIWKGLPPA